MFSSAGRALLKHSSEEGSCRKGFPSLGALNSIDRHHWGC